MTAVEFLGRYRLAEKKVETLAREVERLETAAQGGAIKADGLPHGTAKADSMAEMAARAADQRLVLEAWIAEQNRIKFEIMEVLGAITDLRQFAVLQMRYVGPYDQSDWITIADNLGVTSERQARRIHGDAIRTVEEILENDASI